MAIIDKFTIEVHVDGEPLPEYEYSEDGDHNNAPDTSRVYIEAHEDQKFSIECTVSAGYQMPHNANGTGFELKVDGGYMIERVIQAEAGRLIARDKKASIFRVAVQEGDTFYDSHLKFSQLNITQESVSGKTVEKYNTKGSLRISVWHYNGKSIERPRRSHVEDRDNAVPEKALKGRAITLGVGLDRGTALTGLERIFDARRTDSTPVATFIFEYRTKRSLQELLIIPRSPTPEHVPLVERDPATLTPAEVRQLMDQVRESQQTKQEPGTTIKRERPQSLTFDSDGIEVMSTGKRVRPMRPEDAIVID